ncbi:MAG: hypothetical protein HUJ26_13860 [Planctomycetaceae bacterium]|nr:hypothetical protein [Planctomycetaceae bacterium]
MSEQEFENWLSLLTGLLQLSPEQRDNISDELRSHLEERMEDLLESGSSREEAIAAALEDFGDTAALAHHFTNIAHHHRRRRLMRYTYGTIAAMTCSILVLATFWPGSEPPMTSQGVAQSDLKVPQAADSNSLNPAGQVDAQVGQELVDHPFQGSKEEIERKLSQPLPEQNIVELPFNALLAELGDELGVTIFLDPVITKIELKRDRIVDSGELITLEFPEGTVSAKTLIKYAIKSIVNGDQLGYTIRDNMIVITEKFETYETVIYNCSDLLRPADSRSRTSKTSGDFGFEASGGGGGYGAEAGGAGFGSGVSGGGEGYGSVGRMGGGMGSGMMLGMPKMPPATPEGQLVEVITTTIEPDSWSDNGGTGAISSLNGLIIVKHTREVQDEVKDLLQKLRDARK